MINEVYPLSIAMQDAGITTVSWHPKYRPLPVIKKDAPCVRIVLSGNQIGYIECIDKSLGKRLRKYGTTSQGSFPAMNLAPLYRIDDELQKKEINRLFNAPESEFNISQLRAWCVCDNWGKKFSEKYKRCIQNVPNKMEELLRGNAAYPPLFQLITAVQPFLAPQVLHEELKRAAFEQLERHGDVRLALQILFYCCKKEDSDDNGCLSVILDSQELEEQGLSTAGLRFTKGLNQALVAADTKQVEKMTDETDVIEKDAFGRPYIPLEEPMPAVKLAGGVEVSLRTMFDKQYCQERYDYIGNNTYPISYEMRKQLKDALEWVSREEMRDTTWVKMDTNEILFVYPSRLSEAPVGYTRQFKAVNQKSRFEREAKSFAEYLTKTKTTDPENYPESIQLFAIRKIDKARSKVMFTRWVSSDEVVVRSEEWQHAAKNLPYGKHYDVPFPLTISEIMNRTWKQDGTLAERKVKLISSYHGLELLFGVSRDVLERDLYLLISRSVNVALYGGRVYNKVTGQKKEKFFIELQDALTLTGMLLYWLGSRKENYMKGYPYLFGQLLKVSDGLHELYCYEVRNKEIPPQLVGNSMYVAASEMPTQTFAQLGRRMMPYIAWAKANRNAQIRETRKGEDGGTKEVFGLSAGYLLFLYEGIARQLEAALESKTHFNDLEKAQLFIGYLAAFPKKEDTIEIKNTAGGSSNEQ